MSPLFQCHRVPCFTWNYFLFLLYYNFFLSYCCCCCCFSILFWLICRWWTINLRIRILNEFRSGRETPLPPPPPQPSPSPLNPWHNKNSYCSQSDIINQEINTRTSLQIQGHHYKKKKSFENWIFHFFSFFCFYFHFFLFLDFSLFVCL